MQVPAIYLLLTSCPDTQSAERMSQCLVIEKLAACVTAIPKVRSTYWWEGHITCDEETQLLIKTSPELIKPAIARIQSLHPYLVPEILAIPITAGGQDYFHWVNAVTNQKS